MEKSIDKNLEIIESSILWVTQSLQEERQKEIRKKLVNHRRELKKKKKALESNPAAALFGESQVGKSYLASALLSKEGQPFEVLDGDEKGYNFKDKINPLGNEVESTAVVTRFSTAHKTENKEFPIIAQLLSPTDIVIILCEAYYNNMKASTSLSVDKIKEKLQVFRGKYKEKSECQNYIVEDDILDIEEYFHNNFSELVYSNIKHSGFFNEVLDYINKIPTEEWESVFSIFWNDNPMLTKLFNDLIQKHQELNFTSTIYLPIDAVLREKGTLLDVSRLDEIYDEYKGERKEKYCKTTKLCFVDKKGSLQIVEFDKPYLGALIQEIIFSLPEYIIKEKPFLKETDLLDFPGTRRFQNTKDTSIQEGDLTVLLRRGRVDYLFNKYSANERINSLLFCHNHKQSAQSVMPKKLNDWISKMIGESAEEREQFKAKISPLFVISTWFNKDLEYDSRYNENEQELFNDRWNQRFIKVLKNEIFETDTYNWLVNWKTSNPNFQNIYLLRDFEKSGEEVANGSNLFKGYQEQRKEIEEIKPDSYPNFRVDLGSSFINYDFVQKHFSNPQESWNRSATIGQDGTALIIENLTKLANEINPARISKIKTELVKIKENILTDLKKYYHSNNKDEELQKAKSIAGRIQHQMDMAFSADGIKNYGKLMKDLMIDEATVVRLYKKILQDLEGKYTENRDRYNMYRIQVPPHSEDTIGSYFERLCEHYSKITPKDKQEFKDELNHYGIDLNKVLQGNFDIAQNSAEHLAKLLLEYWKTEYVTDGKQKVIQQILVYNGINLLQDIVDMFGKLFKKIKLSGQISSSIKSYLSTDGANIPYEVIADISAELLNKSIKSVGYDYFNEKDIEELKKANKKNALGLVMKQDNHKKEASVEELFQKIENWSDIIRSNPEEIKSLPNYSNYLQWYNKLKIGFIAVCEIPDYDVVANENLGEIIANGNRINY